MGHKILVKKKKQKETMGIKRGHSSDISECFLHGGGDREEKNMTPRLLVFPDLVIGWLTKIFVLILAFWFLLPLGEHLSS